MRNRVCVCVCARARARARVVVCGGTDYGRYNIPGAHTSAWCGVMWWVQVGVCGVVCCRVLSCGVCALQKRYGGVWFCRMGCKVTRCHGLLCGVVRYFKRYWRVVMRGGVLCSGVNVVWCGVARWCGVV